MANILGIVMIVIFSGAMLVFGIFISWRTRSSGQTARSILIGNHDIGVVTGTLTLSATWVGTAYMFSVAEQLYKPGAGLIWGLGLFSFSITNIINASLIIPKLRDMGFVTILDPMQNKYGKQLIAIMYLLPASVEIFWVSSLLKTLGGSIAAITGLKSNITAIAISATFAVCYTMLGGLYAVAYTDVLQFGLILLGLVLVTPFVLTNKAVGGLNEQIGNISKYSWLGTWDGNVTGYWVDSFLLLCLGYIAYQGLYQRVFAMKSLKKAQIATFLSGIIYFAMGVPAFLIGAAATKTNWTMAGYIDGLNNNNTPAENEKTTNIFPIMIKYLAPQSVAFIALAAISAAGMSSVDSAILSSASLFVQNVYQSLLRKNASDRELLWATRACMAISTFLGALIGATLNSVFLLWYMSADLLYVLFFPQFMGVIYLDVNGYGCTVSMILTIILRVASGEPLFNFPGLIVYPGNEPPYSQFPVKTFLMLFCLFTLWLFSFIFKKLFQTKVIPTKYDFLDSNLAGKGRSYINGKINDVMKECNESLVLSERKN